MSRQPDRLDLPLARRVRRTPTLRRTRSPSQRPHLDDLTGPPGPPEFLFSLSRRHGIPFSVVAVEVDGHESGSGPGPQHGDRVASALRRTDLLVRWGSDARHVIFCPYTTPEGAKELSVRVGEACRVAGATVTGAASFPQDALTLDDLVDAAWSHARESDPRARGPADERSPAKLVQRFARTRLTPTRRQSRRKPGKRVFDLAIVALSMPFWLPLLGAVALAIKVSNPGAPVLYLQLRTGRGGRRFRMYKFRTMIPDADAAKEALASLNQLRWPDFKIENDPRVTRLGRILRKTSLDELPQLLNVARGDMSLVGPRPTSFAADTYELWQTARLDAVPGLTGLWQVEGRTSTEFDERLRLDVAYIEQQSLLVDLKILLRTVGAVFQMRGGC